MVQDHPERARRPASGVPADAGRQFAPVLDAPSLKDILHGRDAVLEPFPEVTVMHTQTS